MEEDMDDKPCMFHDALSLQAAEKSLYDALGEKYPDCLNQTTSTIPAPLVDSPDGFSSAYDASSSSTTTTTSSDWSFDCLENNRPSRLHTPIPNNFVFQSTSIRSTPRSVGRTNTVYGSISSEDLVCNIYVETDQEIFFILWKCYKEISSLFRKQSRSMLGWDRSSKKTSAFDILKLIRNMKPDVFIPTVVKASYNAPFFVTRFREVSFHYSCLFDMCDANLTRADPMRVMFEKEFYGREIMNVVACEGTERVERPESYKQWQERAMRAGFRQSPLYKELVQKLKWVVENGYKSKEFDVDQDGNWLLQGWKGRIVFASSILVPC